MTLTFSQEFLRQRSFEVAWAVFRVSEFVSKKNLKNGLEERALDYFLKRDADSLDSLEDAIQFSFKIGEISEVNTKVLFREINNLRSAIGEILTLNNGNGNGHSEQKMSELAPAIEDYFSKLQLSDFCEEESKSGNEKIEKSEINLASLPEKSPAIIETESLATENKLANELSGKENLVKEKHFGNVQDKSPATTEAMSPANSQKNENDNQNGGEYYMSYKERQNAIMEVLNSRQLCHINDILSVMPGVSARTVRYDLQRMSDNGVVERVGSGGPSSFVRLKR
jgi:hypothetical protein